MPQQDLNLKCKECGKDFVFTVNEQRFYEEKGFENKPSRCPECRQARKRERYSYDREYFKTVCAKCGKETEVPFKPRGDRPIYCRDCYKEIKAK